MSEQIYQIYDRIFKRIFSLSSLAIINLINGLFGTNHPLDSSVGYPSHEFISSHLDKRFADVLLTIQGIPYHLEAQMTKDGAIVVRAFEYEFLYAMHNRDGDTVLHFPEPIIIYLDSETKIPETSTLNLDFGSQGTFTYTVKNFVYQDYEMRELNQRKLIVLIPFQLLKLKRIIEKAPSETHFLQLKNLIQNDILNSIRANLQVGNITLDDANQLRELTLQLYDHIYQHYDELGGRNDMKPLLEGAIELPLDKYRIRIDELEQKTSALEQEKSSLEQEKSSLEQEILHLKALLNEK
ncbi:MAG: bZIP transcription factor [Lachnospiraceae bacterium]|nr:bZIP transcription factor [Lachnospiraceae bacterium]